MASKDKPGKKKAGKDRKLISEMIIDDVLDWYDAQALFIRKAMYAVIKNDFEQNDSLPAEPDLPTGGRWLDN